MRRAAAFVSAASLAGRSSAMPVHTRCATSLAPSSFAPALRLSTSVIASQILSHQQQLHQRSSRVVVRMGAKQMETDWNSVKVLENTVICEDHHYLVINVGTTAETGSLCDAYRFPGMYVQIRKNDAGKPGFFAISCAPNLQGVFEFLIKDAESTEWMTHLAPGDTVQMSPVMGKGFPTSTRLDMFPYPPIPEEERPRDILLFATGSGIAPIRAAIESRLNGINPAQRGTVKLYYGARYPDRMAYKDRFDLWKSDGIEVIPVLSRPPSDWTGRTGYVQDALKEDGIANPSQTGALYCGVKGMTEDVRTILLGAGVKEDRVLSNF
jgi:NAD(P)H-flavin reductase